jgi:hypothetical protein
VVRGAVSARGALCRAALCVCGVFEACELGCGVDGFAAWLSLGRAALGRVVLGRVELARVLFAGRFVFDARFALSVRLVLLLFGGTDGRFAAFAPLGDEPRFAAE